MTATELKLISVRYPDSTPTCAGRRVRLRISEAKQDAARLTSQADAAPNNELRVMLLDRAIDCLKRALELTLALEK
jgi:hypothetical protein